MDQKRVKESRERLQRKRKDINVSGDASRQCKRSLKIVKFSRKHNRII